MTVTQSTRDRLKAEERLKYPQVAVDGVVAKRLDLPYQPGERDLLKVKHLRTAVCVVGGIRYETAQKQVGSLLLGLYDSDDLPHHVGFTSALADADKPALKKRLETLVAPPGFTGNAPGVTPSFQAGGRGYDHVTDKRFRHRGTNLSDGGLTIGLLNAHSSSFRKLLRRSRCDEPPRLMWCRRALSDLRGGS